MHDIIFLLVLIFLTYWSAYFSASEIALFSLPYTKIKAYQFDKDRLKRLIAKLVLHPHHLLVTVFMLNTVVNILIQNVSSSMFIGVSGWGLKVFLPLFIVLVFGEIIPKYFALQHNVNIAFRVAPTIDFFTRILKPIRELAVSVTEPISRILFFFLKKEKTISIDELQHALKTSQKFGVLTQNEAELISGYLNLQNAQVREIMWPREDILFYDIHEPLTKLTYLFVDQECTRLPICDKVLDHVIGILSATQFFLHRDSLTTSQESVNSILSKPFFVPETTSARFLLKQMSEKNESFALVVDEYGTISGLITREDLFEVVVGEISDRRDEEIFYTKAGGNIIIAQGKLELNEFAEIFGVTLPSSNNMLTIGGWLMEQLGSIPKSGTKYETNDFFFQILSADPNRIKSVYIRQKRQLQNS